MEEDKEPPEPLEKANLFANAAFKVIRESKAPQNREPSPRGEPKLNRRKREPEEESLYGMRKMVCALHRTAVLTVTDFLPLSCVSLT